MRVFILILTLLSVRAELIPSYYQVDWTPGTYTGVPGGIASWSALRTNIINVTQSPYNADNTGVSRADTAIQSAIAAAPANSVIYIPAGTYKMLAAIGIGPSSSSNLTIRGAGMSLTKLVFSGSVTVGIANGTAANYDWSDPASNNTVTAGVSKGSSNVTVGSASPWAVGYLARIQIANSTNATNVVVHVDGYQNLRKQMVLVTDKTSTTLTFRPPLYDGYLETVKVHRATAQVAYPGIEDLEIDLTAATAVYGVQLEQCFGAWVKNVKTTLSDNYGIFLYDSAFCEVRGCFANQRKSGGSNGAGILCNTVSASLIEDNIVYKFFPLIEVNQGSSGNAFAYNFMWDSTVGGGVASGMLVNHGPHNSYNLYEGNMAPNIQWDGYFGSASRDTVIRNWLHTMGTNGSTSGYIPVIMNRFTRNQNVVGNILGVTNLGLFYPYSAGNPNIGNGSYTGTAQPTLGDWWADWGTTPSVAGFQELDLDVEASYNHKGNVNGYAGGQDVDPSPDTIPNSYLYTSQPSGYSAYPWPFFGAGFTNPISFGTITNVAVLPAQVRWFGLSEPGGGGGGTTGGGAGTPVKVKRSVGRRR